MKILLGVIFSYLIGSIPSAYLFGKFYKGIDIREHGSGNVGATNVFRVMGKGPGSIVLILDILKGFLAVTVLGDILGLKEIFHRIILSVFVVCGHNWTIFLKFKGGKGIATSLGVLIALTVKIPSIIPVLLLTVGTWILIFLITKFVSVASILAATFLPIYMVLTYQPLELTILGIVFCIFVVLRHKPNIKRLLSGKEPQVPIFQKNKSRK